MRVDPELQVVLAHFAGGKPPNYADPLALRIGNDAMLKQLFGTLPYPEGMKESDHSITSLDGTEIPVRRFLPLSATATGPGHGPKRAAVWAFGGGFFSGSVDVCARVAAQLAEAGSTQVFAVDYRLAPEDPFPKAVEDMYAAVRWLQANAISFDVDPARVVIAGQSAGAGLAAGAALMARDKGLEFPLAGQILKYPMLDDRTFIGADSPLWPHLSWTVSYNDMAWKAYLGGRERAERSEGSVSPYAAPARAEDLSGLPRTFIDTGGLDLFKQEDIAYAARLVAANVDVEFHLYPGVPHGFDGMAMEIGVTRDANANTSRFLSSF